MTNFLNTFSSNLVDFLLYYSYHFILTFLPTTINLVDLLLTIKIINSSM